jgi:hypothetical protein
MAYLSMAINKSALRVRTKPWAQRESACISGEERMKA